MNSSSTKNLSEGVDRDHTIYSLKSQHYIVSTSIGAAPGRWRATKVILNTDSGYNIICRLALPLVVIATYLKTKKSHSTKIPKEISYKICLHLFYL